jgi:ATP-binding cassette subfamily B protein
MGVIRVYNAQTGDRVQVQEMIDDIAGANVRRARLDAWSQGLSIAATTLALSAIVVFGMWLYLHGRVNHGDLLAAVWMTLLLRGPITRLTRSNIIHQRARVASERIAALLDRRGEPGWSPELHGYTGPGREIELRNVGYRNAEGNWDFSRLSHSVRGPGLVAVTDHADGAKTHFLELLLRLRRPHQGRIYLDGHDVRTLRVADLRSRIGWVDRDRRILLVTGSAEAGDDEESASFARAWRWTEALSGGRDADPAQASCMPEAPWRSDGPVPRDWRLRLAVCRALLHDPPILLLDEPAANLDDGAVRRLIDWLRATARERLVIVATNDRRVTAASDQVIRLRAGGTEPAEKQRPAGLRLIVPESQERASMS